MAGSKIALATGGVLLASLTLAHPEIDLQIARLGQQIADRPDDADLYLRRGELYRIHRDWAAAERDFLAARRFQPELPVVDFHLGRLQLDAGQPEQSRRSLDRFLASEPSHVEGLVARARALVELGQPLAAARDYSRAIDVAGSVGVPRPSYYLERSRALESAGKLDQAVRGLDDGLARLGQPVTLELYAIELELRRGRTDAALERLERIASRSPRKETWLVRRGEILEHAGRNEDARRAYASALDAIESLPVSRRWNRAVRRLEASAESALERLEKGGSPARE